MAEVYAELAGGRQARLGLGKDAGAAAVLTAAAARTRPTSRKPLLSEGERTAHLAFVGGLGAAALWRSYLEVPMVESGAK